MPDEILTSHPESAAPAIPPVLTASSDTQLVRRPGVEVVGNWVIDREFNVVRRRYWGKVPVDGIEFPES